MRKEPVLLALDQITTHVAVLGSTGKAARPPPPSRVIEHLPRARRAGPARRIAMATWLATRAAAWWTDASGRQPRAAAPPCASDRRRPLHAGQPAGPPAAPPGDPDASPTRPPRSAKPARQVRRRRPRRDDGLRNRQPPTAHKLSVLQCAKSSFTPRTARSRSISCATRSITRPRAVDPGRPATALLFAPLSEDLQTLAIQRGTLLTGDGEPLDAGSLLPSPGRVDDREPGAHAGGRQQRARVERLAVAGEQRAALESRGSGGLGQRCEEAL